MQTCYTILLDSTHIAIADLVKPGELTPDWTITRINVPEGYRGNGYGSNILRLILADADTLQVTLRLEVAPSGPLDYEDLVSWYGRHGFRSTSSGYMIRRPRS